MVKCIECKFFSREGDIPKCSWGRFSEGDVLYDNPELEFKCGYDKPIKKDVKKKNE